MKRKIFNLFFTKNGINKNTLDELGIDWDSFFLIASQAAVDAKEIALGINDKKKKKQTLDVIKNNKSFLFLLYAKTRIEEEAKKKNITIQDELNICRKNASRRLKSYENYINACILFAIVVGLLSIYINYNLGGIPKFIALVLIISLILTSILYLYINKRLKEATKAINLVKNIENKLLN